MNTTPQKSPLHVSRALADQGIRSSPTNVLKALALKETGRFSTKEILESEICPKSTFYRALKQKAKGYNIGERGRPRKLNFEDEEAIVTYIKLLLKEGTLPSKTLILNLVCFLQYLSCV